MKMTTDFERIRKVLMLEGEPDRVPLAELIIDTVIQEQFLGRKILSIKDSIEFWQKAGYDYIRIVPPYTFNMEKTMIKSDDGRTWPDESKGIINTIEDFEKHKWQKLREIDFSCYEISSKNMPEGMKIIIGAGDIFTHTWELMGFENFSIATVENPELVKLLFEKIGNHIYGVIKTCLDFDNIGAIWYSDDLAYTEGLLVSPKIYREYLFPWVKKIGDLAKKHNIPYLYHTDGVLWEIFDDLIACGVNAIHPIEPKAMKLEEVKKKYGENYKTMLEATFEYGKYPINI